VILYGRNPVAEALRGRRASSVDRVWASARTKREPWLRDAASRGAQVEVVPAKEIERRCGSGAHQGVCASAGPYPYVSPAELLAVREGLVVVLDQVQDPQNLGSICRTAECVGAAGVVIPERRAAEVTPAVCKAAAGAVEHLAVARVRNVADFLGEARSAGYWCYGASAGAVAAPGGAGKRAAGTARGGGPPASSGESARGGGARAPVPYDEPDYAGAGVALVLGSEGTGLRPRVAGACDELVALPLLGRVDSLGVAAAAAALLYEILQGRSGGVDKAP
jgi:23S rRNA (guanosine2251-2'-O)-methyltransferase